MNSFVLVIVGISGLFGTVFSFSVFGVSRDWQVRTVSLLSAANHLALCAFAIKELM